MEEIKVYVMKYPDCANFVMRYLDPESGRQVQRSTGTKNERDANRVAAKWEAELREGRYNRPAKIGWHEFRQLYAANVLDGLKDTTAANYSATLNVFERKMKPGRLAEVTTPKLTAFVTLLRAGHLAPATIARHLPQLKVTMRCAHRQGLLIKLPEFDMPKQAKGMKGRPISLEEFERMLAKAGPLSFYLRGLWTSGLRLTESLELRWEDAPGALVADFTGRRPMLRIPVESENGNTHRLLPVAPEFADLLDTVPESRRRGQVFVFPTDCPRTTHSVCQRVVAVGKAAGVVVKQRQKVGEDGKLVAVNQCASAHDLRRSFGFRWSRKVMQTVLRELMRHESVETTMRYYVGQNAESTADTLWECHAKEAAAVEAAELGTISGTSR